jgi:hypothetical protein
MPYKFNESRRHEIPRARYRLTNWPEYDAALGCRESLTVWFTEEVMAAWHVPATGERGGQMTYSAIAIETDLASRLVSYRRWARQLPAGHPNDVGQDGTAPHQPLLE